jgi:hypothetical protein
VVTRSFVIGNTIVGIRTNSEAFGEWLAETLVEYQYEEDDPSPYYSIYVADGEGSVGKQFHLLFRESATVLKTFDLSELGRALVANLETHSLSLRDDGIYVVCSPVTKHGTTALAPSDLVSYTATAGRRLTERYGLGLPESFAVAVDSTGMLRAVPRTLDLPADAFERLAEIAPTRTTPRTPAEVPGSLDLVLFGNFWPNGGEPVRPLSRGLALYHLASLTKNLDVLRTEALLGLARLLEGVRCYEIRQGPAAEVLERLSEVLEGQRAAVEVARLA